jgi:hypothetical protein
MPRQILSIAQAPVPVAADATSSHGRSGSFRRRSGTCCPEARTLKRRKEALVPIGKICRKSRLPPKTCSEPQRQRAARRVIQRPRLGESRMSIPRKLHGALLAAVVTGFVGGAVRVAAAPPGADDLEAAFHKAYFAEVEQGNYAAALVGYEGVAHAPGASQELKVRAQARADSCREALRAADLFSLLPPDALAYAEVSRPGQHLARILEKMGPRRRRQRRGRIAARAHQPEAPRWAVRRGRHCRGVDGLRPTPR